MNKEFIPYEEALALKELGFDEMCFGSYSIEGDFHTWDDEFYTKAPLYQQAFRWFRKEHNILSNINLMGMSSYCVVLQLDTEEWRNKLMPNGCFEEIVDLYSYEEAELACLKKLIKIVNTKTK